MDKTGILIMLVFLLGFVSNGLFSNIMTSGVQFPAFMGLESSKTAEEVDSPSDHVKDAQVHVYDDKVLLDVKNAEWSVFTDTNSMDPVLDKGSNGIEVKPKHPEQISVGDIISYRSELIEGIIVHRVIKTGEDEDGWFAITKGDNNPSEDPEKVRFSQVQGVVIAIIY